MSDHNEKDRPEYEFGEPRWLIATLCQLTDAWAKQDTDELEQIIDLLDDYSWLIEH